MTKDLYDHRLAKAMLLTEGEPFNSKDYIYELKLDGIRALAYLEPGKVDIRNKRGKWLNPTYPELEVIHKSIHKRCILDGELVVMSGGKPDFYALRRRSIMTDPFKIQLETKRNPVIFVAYDLIYWDHSELIDLPLMERKEKLSEIEESDHLIRSQFIYEKGIELFEHVKSIQLEGVVAKKQDSIYQQNVRSKYWIKFKYLKDADFVICGVSRDGDGRIKSLRLGLFEEGKLIDYGHVAMGISNTDAELILNHLRTHPLSESPFDRQMKREQAEWMKPKYVCTVEFMAAGVHGLRQPIFKGIREDKDIFSCTTDQITIEYE